MYSLGVMRVLDTDGTYVAYIGLHHQEDGKGYIQELSSPGGLALSMDGKAVAVADTGNCRQAIMVYTNYLHLVVKDKDIFG